MNETEKNNLIREHGIGAAAAFALTDAATAPKPGGKHEVILRDLAERMTVAMKAVKRGKASYWSAGETERVYVTNQAGKKAGYIEMVDDKASYRECAASDLIAIFRAARKAQKSGM